MVNGVCYICQTSLTIPYVRCAECSKVDLCEECFATGKERAEHLNCHAYRYINRDYSLFEIDWTAQNEIDLLDALLLCGMDNWEGVSKRVLNQTSEQCKKHYYRYYIHAPQAPLPVLKKVERTFFPSPYRYSKATHPVEERKGYSAPRGEFHVTHMNDGELTMCNLQFPSSLPDNDAEEWLSSVGKRRLNNRFTTVADVPKFSMPLIDMYDGATQPDRRPTSADSRRRKPPAPAYVDNAPFTTSVTVAAYIADNNTRIKRYPAPVKNTLPPGADDGGNCTQAVAVAGPSPTEGMTAAFEGDVDNLPFDLLGSDYFILHPAVESEQYVTTLRADLLRVMDHETDKLKREARLLASNIYRQVLFERRDKMILKREHGMSTIEEYNGKIQRYIGTIGITQLHRRCKLMTFLSYEEFHNCLETEHQQILLTRSLKKDLQHLSEGIRHKKIGRTVDIINEQHKNYTNPHYHMNRALQVIQKLNSRKAIAKILVEGNKVKTNRLDITNQPFYDKLNGEEQELCSEIRVVPHAYLQYKQILLKYCTGNGGIRLINARHHIKIDVNKTRKIFNYLISVNFIYLAK